jgi:adenosylhomocysteine nucleosidase
MNASVPPPTLPRTPAPRFHLGIVTGLHFEAEIARAAIAATGNEEGGDIVTVACHGPGQERGLSAARSLLDVGATALLSFGVAGGCNPALPSGTIVISTGIRDLSDIGPEVGPKFGSGEVLYTNREWQRRLKARLLGAVLVEEAMIASISNPATGAADKQLLFNDMNAAAVDMESAAVARAATEATVPFMALRAVLDDAATTLPPAALAGLRPDGNPDTGAVIRGLLHRPQDLPALIGLAAASRKAKRALGSAASAIAPMFSAV